MNNNLLSIFQFPDGRLDTKNASVYLGLSVKTLAMMRTKGTGPKFIKRGRVFYYKSDLEDWVTGRGKVISAAQWRANSLKIKVNEQSKL